MLVVLTIIHILVCFFLAVVVLLQSGKAADLAGAFGGMGSQTAFGPRGSATVLSKATTVAAAVFMLTSLTLAIMATRNASSSGSVLERQKQPVKTAPAQSAPVQQAPLQSVPAQPGKAPSVSVTPSDGKTTTVPLQIPPAPSSTAPAGQQQPAQKK